MARIVPRAVVRVSAGRVLPVVRRPWFFARRMRLSRIRYVTTEARRWAVAADAPPLCTALVPIPHTRIGVPSFSATMHARLNTCSYMLHTVGWTTPLGRRI